VGEDLLPTPVGNNGALLIPMGVLDLEKVKSRKSEVLQTLQGFQVLGFRGRLPA